MTLIILLVAALLTSLAIGLLAKLPPKELLIQTAGMTIAALGFYGLTALL